MGMDWHSSGIPTVVLGALKTGPVTSCGGNTPGELHTFGVAGA